MAERRIDPDPFTIIAAVAGVVGAATGTIALWRDAERPLPSRIRGKLLGSVDALDDHLLHLDADVSEIEKLFGRAEFPSGRFVRLGNGGRLTRGDFSTYQRVSSSVFKRLDKVYGEVLKLEKLTSSVPYIDDRVPANRIGEFHRQIEGLLQTRDLSVEQSWGILRGAIENIRDLCRIIRDQLS